MKQIMKEEEAIKRYSAFIYTKQGDISLQTLRKIAIAAGLKNPVVRRDCCDDIFIDYECIDPYGEAVEEVRSAYNFCRWLAKKDVKKDCIEKLQHLEKLPTEKILIQQIPIKLI